MQRPPGSEMEAGQCAVARAVLAATAGPVTAATTIVGSVLVAYFVGDTPRGISQGGGEGPRSAWC